MKKHRTLNIEHRTPNPGSVPSMLHVRCLMFKVPLSLFTFLSFIMILSACQNLDSHSTTTTHLHWEKLPTIPDPEGFAGAFAGTHNGALIVAGGANIVGDKWGTDFKKIWYDSVFVLESPTTTWQTGFKLPRPLGYGVSISTKDGIVCIGGSDADGHHADVFQMSWRDGKINFTPLPTLPKPCANYCGEIIDQTIYIAGGIETPSSTTAQKTFWKLDLGQKNPSWEELEPWPGPERMLAVAGVANGSFYLFSGTKLKMGADGKPAREYLHDAYRYTPGKGWVQLAVLPRAVVAAPSPAVQAGNKLLIFSGDDGTKTDFQPVSAHPGFPRDILAFDLKNHSWSIVGEVPFSRATAPVVEWRGNAVVINGEARPRERTAEVWWTKISP
ncbi:MAG: galactose oxidase [Verrucomicrobiota bacterium]